jgi:hypothetical protein
MREARLEQNPPPHKAHPSFHHTHTHRERRRVTPLLEELGNDSDQVGERKIVIGHEPFDLVEFRQVGGVQRLISEHSVDGKVLLGRERLLLACRREEKREEKRREEKRREEKRREEKRSEPWP